MKSILRILITLFITTAAIPAHAKVCVVASLPDLASICLAVGGNLVEVESLTRPGQDPHHAAATPAMVVKLSRADLFVHNGLELEIGWVPALLQSARNEHVRAGGRGHVDASFQVTTLDVPSGPVNRSQGDVHPGGNPHYTLDPVACKRAAWNICNGLMRVDPANAGLYVERLRAFYARADAAVARARALVASYRGANVVVYHTYYRYLTNRLQLIEVGSIEPLPGIPPSAAHLARLIAGQRNKHVRLVFVEPWNDRRIANRLAGELGARVVVPIPAVGTSPGTEDVLQLFEKNAALIAAALGGGQ